MEGVLLKVGTLKKVINRKRAAVKRRSMRWIIVSQARALHQKM